MTEWGEEIQVDGVRPAWLADGTRVKWSHAFGGADTTAEALTWSPPGGTRVATIRLPADHFAYLAIEKGFEPWGGGPEAPADWDGGPVLMRDGMEWPHGISWWSHDGGYSGPGAVPSSADIIGYRKRALLAAKQPEGNAVTIARMTRAEADREARAHVRGFTARTHFVLALEKMGLIREETVAERFARETGHEVTPAVEAALSWGKGL